MSGNAYYSNDPLDKPQESTKIDKKFNDYKVKFNSKYLQSRSNELIADSLSDRYRLYIEENYK